MTTDIFLFISKRSQRYVVAFLGLVLVHVLVASCTPEPISPMAARVMVSH